MNKKIKKAIFISIALVSSLIILGNVISNNRLSEEAKIDLDKVYKVAFYNHPPYYYTNDKLEKSGYYHELMELISKKLGIKYEYVDLEIAQCIDKVIKNDIDLVFGVSKDTTRKNELLFSKNAVAKEEMSVYLNKYIERDHLDELEGLNVGYLKHESNNTFFLDSLDKQNIKVNLTEYKSYKELKEGFMKNEVDSIVYLSTDKDLKKYSKVLNFSIGELYISTSKENIDLISYIDLYIGSDRRFDYNSLKLLNDKYFNENFNKNRTIYLLLVTSTFIIILICGAYSYNYLSKNYQLNKMKNKILSNIKNNNYILYYQPIVNPKNNEVKGFEGLLRLKENNEILSPIKFLKQIEEANMMSEVSLWILQNVISDYNIIKSFDCVSNNDFYISINLSFREIEDERFIEYVKEIIGSEKLIPNSICLEIVERFPMTNLNKIQDSIYKLKELGFMVAIDDFGVEYSNLDILEKVNCDIVKLDKYFIDEINESFIRKEIVNFISNICKYTNKIVICEGVEDEYQKDIIKEIDNDQFYIQGYYYSKPLSIYDLKKFKVK